MDSCFLPMHRPFFHALQRGTEPDFDIGGFPAQLLALHCEILTARWLHENFVVHFLHILSNVSHRQGTYRETNVCEGRIDLSLKFVIWHRSATRFRNSQGGMKTLHDEYFGYRLIFFMCSDHVIHDSYLNLTLKSIPLISRSS